VEKKDFLFVFWVERNLQVGVGELQHQIVASKQKTRGAKFDAARNEILSGISGPRAGGK